MKKIKKKTNNNRHQLQHAMHTMESTNITIYWSRSTDSTPKSSKTMPQPQQQQQLKKQQQQQHYNN